MPYTSYRKQEDRNVRNCINNSSYKPYGLLIHTFPWHPTLPDFASRITSKDRDDHDREIEENINPDNELSEVIDFTSAIGHE